MEEFERDILNRLINGFLEKHPEAKADKGNIILFHDYYDTEHHCPVAYTGEFGKHDIIVIEWKNHWGCARALGGFGWARTRRPLRAYFDC